jgi:carbon storage regulator CsrA
MEPRQENVVIGTGITVIQIKGNQVRVGIEAPDPVCILRGEPACRQKDRPEVMMPFLSGPPCEYD